MAAEIIQLADRRGQTEADDFQREMEARREFHEAFRFEMRAAFERVKGRRIGVMDHLDYDEFEVWVADRILKRKRMRDVRQQMLDRRDKTDAYIRSRAGQALFDERKLEEEQ